MSRRRPLPARLGLLAALGLSACPSATPLGGDAPAELRFAAVLVLDGGGAVARTTALVAWPAGQPLPLAVPADTDAVVLAWSETALDAAGLLEPARSAGSVPLVPAEGCTPHLPQPSWGRRWAADGSTSPTDGAAWPLTAPWVESACGRDAIELAAAVSCLAPRCAPAITPISPCRFRLDLAACSLPAPADRASLEATIDATGRLCVESRDPSWRCEATPPAPGADASLSCSAPECRFELYLDPAARPPTLDVARVAVHPDGAPYLDDAVKEIPLFMPSTGMSGYLHELVRRGDRLYVSGVPDGRAPRAICPSFIQHSALRILDADTGRTIRTATSPDCLDALAVDPLGDGLLALVSVDETWSLARIDAEGRFVATTSTALGLRHVLPGAGTPLRRGYFVVPVPELGLGLAGFGVAPSGVTPWSELVVFRLDTLRPEAPVQLSLPSRPHRAVALGDGRVAVQLAESRQILRVDLGQPQPFERPLTIDLPGDLEIRASLQGTVWDPETGRLWMTAHGRVELFSVDPGTGAIDEWTLFDREVVGLSALRWPGQPRRWLFGASTFAEWNAVLVLFDEEAGRFELPTHIVGHGVVTDLVPHPDGRSVWALSPWTGELLRVSLR